MRPRIPNRNPKPAADRAARARTQVLLEDAALLTDWQRRQAEYKAKRKLTGKREADILSRLTSFQTKVPRRARAGPRIRTGGRGRDAAPWFFHRRGRF